MILLDSDIIILDLRYTRDPRFAVNQQALHLMRTQKMRVGMTVQGHLEVTGNLSFNLPANAISLVPSRLVTLYGLEIIPDPQVHPQYAGVTIDDLVQQMSRQMALGDTVQAVQIARYAADADCLLSWNARHFAGKLVIPVLTPEDWLRQRTTP